MKIEFLLVLFASTTIFGQALDKNQHRTLEAKLLSKQKRTFHRNGNKQRNLKKDKKDTEKCAKSKKESCAPSSFPSSMISSVPSEKPSSAPTVTPTLIPTEVPSLFPTLAPSSEPSINPTPAMTCPVEAVLGKTYLVQMKLDGINRCYKIELFEGGNMFSSSSCSGTFSNKLSEFAGSGENIVFFLGSKVDVTFYIIENKSATDVTAEVVAAASGRQPMVINLIFPTCSAPSTTPSATPTTAPSSMPSLMPTTMPSILPSAVPSSPPSEAPSAVPSSAPSSIPSSMPSLMPTTVPSVLPSAVPTSMPSSDPSSMPSLSLSEVPSVAPSATPSSSPSQAPSLSTSYCSTVGREIVLPAVYKSTNYCYKVEVEANGKLFVDTADLGCLVYNTFNTYGGFEISSYQSSGSNGIATYSGVWSGEITVIEDATVSQDTLVINPRRTNSGTKTFVMTLTVTSCN